MPFALGHFRTSLVLRDTGTFCAVRIVAIAQVMISHRVSPKIAIIGAHHKIHTKKRASTQTGQQDAHTFDKIAPMTESNLLPQTLSEFLQQIGAQVQFYDMGRRLVEIPAADMLAIERQQQAYPQPFLRSASLGVVFYDEDGDGANSDQQIWFLKFPLDEQGLLQQAARDDFLRRLVAQMAEQALAKHDPGTTQNPPDMPEDNPHGFTPREDRMACFHAKVAKRLGQPASQFYAHAVDYFTGSNGFEQWRFVGLQGIADVAARLDEDDNLTTLVKAIPQLPITPFAALCSCLENEAIAPALSVALSARIAAALQETDTHIAANTVAATLRGLSYGNDQQTLTIALRSVLASDSGRNVEVLATIAGRAWQCLDQDDIRHAFLYNLALCDAGQGAFDNIMADLMFMPGLRQPLLNELHSLRDTDNCTQPQTDIINDFFQSLQT